MNIFKSDEQSFQEYNFGMNDRLRQREDHNEDHLEEGYKSVSVGPFGHEKHEESAEVTINDSDVLEAIPGPRHQQLPAIKEYSRRLAEKSKLHNLTQLNSPHQTGRSHLLSGNPAINTALMHDRDYKQFNLLLPTAPIDMSKQPSISSEFPYDKLHRLSLYNTNTSQHTAYKSKRSRQTNVKAGRSFLEQIQHDKKLHNAKCSVVNSPISQTFDNSIHRFKVFSKGSIDFKNSERVT